MPSALFNSSSNPSRPDEDRFITTDLGSDFEPFVEEVLNKNGGVTRIEVSRTTNPGGSAIPQHQLAQVGDRVKWGYDESPWTKGISTIRPEKSVTRTFFDEYGKAFNYTCHMRHRKLKQDETIVQKYRMADFALSQLRCGIQGTARMLPSRISSHTKVARNSQTDDDDYEHVPAVNLEKPTLGVQSSDDFEDVGVFSGFEEEEWEEVDNNTPCHGHGWRTAQPRDYDESMVD